MKVPIAIVTAVALVVIGTLSIVVGARGCFGEADTEETKVQARQFGTDLGLKVVGVTCMTHDSDGDGYVSCTIRYEESTGIYKTMAIECAGGWAAPNIRGCKQVQLRAVPAGQ